MPKIGIDNDVMTSGTSAGGYQYSGTRPDKLGALSYTITQIVTDQSGSVYDYKNEIEAMLEAIREACNKCDNNLNLLQRVTKFNHTLEELHGFRELVTIQPGEYKGTINPTGNTALTDAACESLDCLKSYAGTLKAKDYTCNAIGFIITDGEENSSVKTEAHVKKLVEELRKGELVESIRIILVGLVPQGSKTSQELDNWKTRAGIDEYVCVGEATPQRLAKLADFVSKSVSSTSQALRTGQASKPITAVTF
jgi:hypothetical protein